MFACAVRIRVCVCVCEPVFIESVLSSTNKSCCMPNVFLFEFGFRFLFLCIISFVSFLLLAFFLTSLVSFVIGTEGRTQSKRIFVRWEGILMRIDSNGIFYKANNGLKFNSHNHPQKRSSAIYFVCVVFFFKKISFCCWHRCLVLAIICDLYRLWASKINEA